MRYWAAVAVSQLSSGGLGIMQRYRNSAILLINIAGDVIRRHRNSVILFVNLTGLLVSVALVILAWGVRFYYHLGSRLGVQILASLGVLLAHWLGELLLSGCAILALTFYLLAEGRGRFLQGHGPFRPLVLYTTIGLVLLAAAISITRRYIYSVETINSMGISSPMRETFFVPLVQYNSIYLLLIYLLFPGLLVLLYPWLPRRQPSN